MSAKFSQKFCGAEVSFHNYDKILERLKLKKKKRLLL